MPSLFMGTFTQFSGSILDIIMFSKPFFFNIKIHMYIYLLLGLKHFNMLAAFKV